MPKPCYSKCRKCTKEICKEVLHKGTYSDYDSKVTVSTSAELILDLERGVYACTPCMYGLSEHYGFGFNRTQVGSTLIDFCDYVIAAKNTSLEDTLKYVKIKNTYKEEQDAYKQRNKRRNVKSTSRSKQKI